MLKKTTLIACVFSFLTALGCETEKPKKEAWQKREQVYTDKTPDEWLALIQHRNVQARDRAIDALIQYGKDGRDTVPQLIEILDTSKSGDVRLSVCRALGGMRSDAKRAVPALCKALNDATWGQRDAAAQALGDIGADGQETISTLIGALKSDLDERVRIKAAAALGRLRSGDSKAVAALAAALEDQNENVRASAAEALGTIGSKAKAAVAALKKAAESEYFIVSSAAEEALKKVQ